MAKILSEQEKQKLQEAAAKRRAFMAGSDVVMLIDEWKPVFFELEKGINDIFERTSQFVIAACYTLDMLDDDGQPNGKLDETHKKRVRALVDAVTGNKVLQQACASWIAVVLGGQDVTKITTYKQLNEAAKQGNENLGVKSRGKTGRKASAEIIPLNETEIWPQLEIVLKTQAGVNKCRQVLNKCGFEMLLLKTQELPGSATVEREDVSIPTAVLRERETANVERTLRLDAEIKAKAAQAAKAKAEAKAAKMKARMTKQRKAA